MVTNQKASKSRRIRILESKFTQAFHLVGLEFDIENIDKGDGRVVIRTSDGLKTLRKDEYEFVVVGRVYDAIAQVKR